MAFTLVKLLQKNLRALSGGLLVVSILVVTFGFTASAQTTPQINYQGKLTSASGVAVADGTYNMRFWLLTTPSIATTSAVWTESLTTTSRVQVTNGLFSVMLGSSTPLTGVDFNQALYLGVEIGSTTTVPSWDGEMSPRKIIGTVPAAFEARRLDGVASSSFLRSDEPDTMQATSSNTLLTLVQNGVGAIARFFSGATEVFTILANGNVGVGTSTPSQQFTVAGNARITGALFDGTNASGTQGMVLQTTGTTTRWVATSTLGFSTVGILDDLTDVTISTPGTGSVLSYNGSQWVNAATSTLGLSSAFTTSAQLAALLSDETGTGSVVFGTGASLSSTTLSGTTYVSGSLGVGTTSPSAKLSIVGTNGQDFLSIASSTGSVTLALLQNGDLELPGQLISAGIEWTARSAAGNNDSWYGVTYGGGLFVAGGFSGDRVMTSPDGVNWTARSAAGNDDFWLSFTYGNGLFVGVGSLGDRVITSPDGVNWTARSAAGNDDGWYSVTYGNGLFVAVGDSGDRVMTSPDGINWTARSAVGNDDTWRSVTYGNGLFVAVADGVSVSDRVMTSPDGINWTAQTAAGDNDPWSAVTYGNGLFVAVGESGDTVMTSPDGTNWTPRSATGLLRGVTYGNGLFVAVSGNVGSNKAITSPDGINWTARTPAGNDDNWHDITYGNGTFVAVGQTNDRVMTSGKQELTALTTGNIYQGGMSIMGGSVGIGTTSPSALFTVAGDMRLTGRFSDSASSTGTNGMVLQTTGTGVQWVATSTLGFGTSSVANINDLFDVTITGAATGNLLSYNGSQWVNAATSTLGLSSAFTTSAQLAALLSDETGTGATVFGTGATLASTTLSGTTYLSGSVGVGTTSPSAKLSIVGTTGQDFLYVASTSGSTTLALLQNGNLELPGQLISAGINWTARTSAGDNTWRSVTYGNGLFVAVSRIGSSVMTSPDGINWTTRSPASGTRWNAVAYGNGLFVAVGDNGAGARLMTSPDGVNWTTRTAADRGWRSVTYGNGLFVVVSSAGESDGVMTSSDGVTWTTRTPAVTNAWRSVTYGNGRFVVVANSGTGDRVMISSDGISWATSTSAADNNWQSVTYGNGLFVAVAESGTADRVMISPDGITWTAQTPPDANAWYGVTYGNGLFVAVSYSGTNRVMTSPDGINWTARRAAADNEWISITYGNGRFVAVGQTGTGNRVMTSGKTEISALATNNLYQGGMNIFGNVGIGTSSPSATLTIAGDMRLTGRLADSASSTGTTGMVLQTTDSGVQWVATSSLGISAGASALASLTDVSLGATSTGQLLSYNGSAWTNVATSTLGIAIGDTTGTLAATRGGTGLSTITQNQLLIGGVGNTWSQVATSSLGLSAAFTTSAALAALLSDETGTGATVFGTGATLASTTLSGTTFFSGNVGIGTSSPSALLTVAGDMRLTGRLADSASSTGTLGQILSATANGTSWISTSTLGLSSAFTTSAHLAALLSDEIGTGAVVFGVGATLSTTTLSGTTYVSGSLGVGTNTPQQLLHVSGSESTGSGVVALVENTAMTGSPYSVFRLRSAGTNYGQFFGGAEIPAYGIVNGITMSPGTEFQDIGFRVGSAVLGGATGPALIIKSSGNVGIGTSSPSALLTVAGDMRLTGRLADSASSTGTLGQILSATANGTSWISTSTLGLSSAFTSSAGLAALLSDETGSGNVVFSTLPTLAGFTSTASSTIGGGTPTTGLTIAGNSTTTGNAYFAGNVGIGKQPTANIALDLLVGTQGLRMQGAAASDLAFTSYVTGDSQLRFLFQSDGAMRWGSGSVAADTNLYRNAPNVLMTDDSFIALGNMAVGTTTSLAKLTVQANIGDTEALVFAVGSSTASATTTLFSVGNTGDVTAFGDIYSKGIQWKLRDTGLIQQWSDITYGNGLFVAVSLNGTNKVMTSPDGINWTSRVATGANTLYSVTYGNGLFVAVGNFGTVAVSSNGVNWSVVNSADVAGGDDTWTSVTYGNGLFVAVADTGVGSDNVVMTSPDGITWTARSAADDDDRWQNIVYGYSTSTGGLFVAVGNGGDDIVMTSTDGINWNTRSAADDNDLWRGVAYGNGLFVAVGSGAGTERVMTSADGISWTVRSAAGNDDSWLDVAYGNGLFVAVSNTGDRVMTSPDGIDWTVRYRPENISWRAVTYGNGAFVTVSLGGTTNYSMTSGKMEQSILAHDNIYQGGLSVFGILAVGSSTPSADYFFMVGSTSPLFVIDKNTGNVGIGSSTPGSLLTMRKTTGISGTTTAGINQFFNFTNSVQSAQQFGNYTYIVNAPSATTTLVGNLLRVEDNSIYGNTVRGLEVQTERGTNTRGENTALSGTARTFGVRGITIGDAGESVLPAGVLAESRGTTQGNALRAYSGSLTSENLVYFYHDNSAFTGTGLRMNFGNTGSAVGSFATTSKFIDLQIAGTSRFTVTAHGTTTIGVSGSTANQAGLQIFNGGLCVDNDGSCSASTSGRISSVSSVTGNSDLAEMYFSTEDLEPGDIVHTEGLLSIGRANAETEDIILGVVSTKPGLLMGFDDKPSVIGAGSYPVALSGRVPVRLSTENGPIKAGDKIALSSIPGVGMKATEGGIIVGVSLEDFDGEYAYSRGFVDQFGDDIPGRVVRKKTVTENSDGCYLGGGAEVGSKPCVPNKSKTNSGVEVSGDDEERNRVAELMSLPAETMLTASGTEVSVGKVLLFVNLAWYQPDQYGDILAELTAATTTTSGAEETLWARLKNLANGFVDGVLTVLRLKASEVQTDKLCVGETCVDEETLKELLRAQGQESSGAPSTPPLPPESPPGDEGGGGSTVEGDGGGGDESDTPDTPPTEGSPPPESEPVDPDPEPPVESTPEPAEPEPATP